MPSQGSTFTTHTFSSAVSVMGSYPDPVRALMGTSLKLKLANTVPLGERFVALTFTSTDPRGLVSLH